MQLRQTDTFNKWISKLKDMHGRARILARIKRLSMGNPGDVKPVDRRRQSYSTKRYSKSIKISAKPLRKKKMTSENITIFTIAEHLRSPEEMAAYLQACIEQADGDSALIINALEDIAKAKGMSQIAQDSGVSRQNLYKTFSGNNDPSFNTVIRIINALGVTLHAEASKKEVLGR